VHHHHHFFGFKDELVQQVFHKESAARSKVNIHIRIARFVRLFECKKLLDLLDDFDRRFIPAQIV